MAKVVMPQLGESVAEGTILRWLKREGEKIEKDELLFEVSTAKIDSEIPSPTEGVLARILVPEGETVPVGQELAEISEGGAPAAEPAAPEAKAEVGRAEEPAAPAPSPAPVVIPEDMVVSPAVRKLAREHNVDLAQVQGSGAGGRVTKKDVEIYLAAAPAAAPEVPAAEPAPAAPAAPAFVPREEGLEETTPLSHMRKMIAQHMMRSHTQTAHLTALVEVDLTEIEHYRQGAKEEFKRSEGFSLTYLPFVAKAACEALMEMPVVNSTLVDGDSLVMRRYVHLGIAVALPDGLIVPVVRRAEEKTVLGLARSIYDLATRAREKRLSPDEAVGSTFTITNPGVFGSVIGTPIINYPEVAILSFEAVQRRPHVVDDAIAIRSMVYVPLTYDHRVMDGMQAAQFLGLIKKRLEAWDFSQGIS